MGNRNPNRRMGRPRTPRPGKFDAWLAVILNAPTTKGGLTLDAVAMRIGVSVPHVYGLRNGSHQPSGRVAARIEEVSDGAVPAASWFKPRRKRGGKAA